MTTHAKIALEIIVTDASEAIVAQRAGASRVELVADRASGGVTPDPKVIEAVVAAVTIPVHVMLRPHDRGFVYDADARSAIVAAARRATELSAAALVVGGLDSDGDVDTALLAEVREQSSLPITFHRAFDEARDAIAAYDALARIDGVSRVLTSGAAPSAWEGRETLRALVERPGPIVLAAAGITAEGVRDVVRATGVREVHVGTGARIKGTLDPGLIKRIVSALETSSNPHDA